MAQEKFSEDELLQIFQSMMGPAVPATPPPPVASPAPVAPPPPPSIAAAPPPISAAPPPPPVPVPAVPAVPTVAPVAPAPVAPMAPVAPPPPPTAPQLPPSPTASEAAPAAAAPAVPPAPPAPAPGAVVSQEELKAVDDLGHQFEIGRVRMEQVLSPFIGEKVSKKMLAWSLDRAQKTHPVLKNVHWSPAGDLLDNGEIEVARLVKNVEGFAGHPVVDLVKMAMLDLLVIRLEAVEKGLGPSMKQAVEKEVVRLREILK